MPRFEELQVHMGPDQPTIHLGPGDYTQHRDGSITRDADGEVVVSTVNRKLILNGGLRLRGAGYGVTRLRFESKDRKHAGS